MNPARHNARTPMSSAAAETIVPVFLFVFFFAINILPGPLDKCGPFEFTLKIQGYLNIV